MATKFYIDKILSSPIQVFNEIIEELTAKNFYNSKIELVRQPFRVDVDLFESIKGILQMLHEEEGFFSRFIYKQFGIQMSENKRREELIVLGSQLKQHCHKLKEELLRVQVNIDALILSIERLEELEEGIFNKNFYILNKELSKKSDFYIAEIQKNIKELKYYKTFLESKFNDLNDTQKVHLRLFKKIPRYYELSGAHQHLQLEK
jgi:hypothetical protein